MPTSYTSLLGFALPVTGELQGTWGTTVNDSITELVEDAIAATATASVTSGNWTLSTTGSGAANEARCAILIPTGTPGVSRNIIAPSQSKAYIVINQSDAAVVLKGSATTGVSLIAGEEALVAWNGSDFIKIASSTGTGDVVGPASSTDNAIVRFDGTTGKLVQNSGVTIDDSGNMVISVNSATDALRITQTGAGNALLVEDSANPDSTPFVVDASGRVLVGNTLPVTLSGSANPFVQVNATGAGASYSAVRWENTANQPFVFLTKSRSTTVGTFGTIVQSGDALGSVNFLGDDGTTTPVIGAAIVASVDGTPGTNDMPGRLVFSTTADGASSPTERMRIDSAGRVSVGSSGTIAGQSFRVNLPITGSTTSYGIVSAATVQSDVTVAGMGYRSNLSTAAASFTVTDLIGYYAEQATIGAGSTVTNQYGFLAQSSLTGATNNYGFHSNIASGTGRWNFYAAGTADNYFAGSVGIGIAPNATTKVRIGGSATGNVTQYGVINELVAASDVTGLSGFTTSLATAASAFTLTEFKHFNAAFNTVGATSTVTNQYAFFASSGLTGATNNYGFYGNIASGTNRWNLYMNGTAENYLGGNLKIGATTARGTTAGTNHLSIFNGTAPAGTLTNGITLYSASGDFNFMDSSGNGFKVGFRNIPAVGTKTGSYTLATGDVGKYVQLGSGGSITIPDATFAEGDVISIFNNTTGNITITCSITTAYIAGTDTDKATMTLATRGVATVLFISSTVCVVSGNVT